MKLEHTINGDGYRVAFVSDDDRDIVTLYNTRLGVIAHAWVTYARLIDQPVHESLPVFINAVERERPLHIPWAYCPRVRAICERDGVIDKKDGRTVAEWATPREIPAP